MPLIKDSKLIQDSWVNVVDVDDLPLAENLIVSLESWQSRRQELMRRNGKLGIRLKSDQSPALIAEDLQAFDLVVLEFPVFKDGRAFSYARLLRDRYGFTGEVRAVGDVLRDQLVFMERCGIDSFEVAGESALDGWLEARSELSIVYQPGADARRPALALRQGLVTATAPRPLISHEDEDDDDDLSNHSSRAYESVSYIDDEPVAVQACAGYWAAD